MSVSRVSKRTKPAKTTPSPKKHCASAPLDSLDWAELMDKGLRENHPYQRIELFEQLLCRVYQQFLRKQLTQALSLHLPQRAEVLNDKIERAVVAAFEAGPDSLKSLPDYLKGLKKRAATTDPAAVASVQERETFKKISELLKDTEKLRQLSDAGLLFRLEAEEAKLSYENRTSFRLTKELLAWLDQIIKGCDELIDWAFVAFDEMAISPLQWGDGQLRFLGFLGSWSSENAEESDEEEEKDEEDDDEGEESNEPTARASPNSPAGRGDERGLCPAHALESQEKIRKVIAREKHRQAYKALAVDDAKFEGLSKEIREAQSLEQLKQLSLGLVTAFQGCDIIAKESKRMLRNLRAESDFGGYQYCPQKDCREIRLIHDYDGGPLLESCLCGDGESESEDEESDEDDN